MVAVRVVNLLEQVDQIEPNCAGQAGCNLQMCQQEHIICLVIYVWYLTVNYCIMSLQAGYYMPKVDVIRRDYEIMYPALEDLQFAGINIMLECGGYNTYRLEKRDPFDRLIGNYIIALLN